MRSHRLILPTLLLPALLLGCRDEPKPRPSAQPPGRQSSADANQAAAAALPEQSIDLSSDLQPTPAPSVDPTPPEWMLDTTAWDAAAQTDVPSPQEIDPNAETDPVLLLAAGRHALAGGQRPRAIRCFRRATDLAPDATEARRGLGLAYAAAGQYGRALKVYHAILTASPDDQTARYNFAVACSRLGRRALAEKAYRELLQAEPGHLRARYNLACLLQKGGELTEALKHWHLVASTDEESPRPHTAMGEVYLDLGRYDKAMFAFAEAAQRSPDDAMAWLAFSDAAKLAGSFGRAMAGAERAVRVDPNAPLPLARLGKLQVLVGRSVKDDKLTAAGVRNIRRSLRIDPSQKDLRDWLTSLDETD
ncbi:MAG: tetratricopeptide repeat protein [Phycisphaerae bacterium]